MHIFIIENVGNVQEKKREPMGIWDGGVLEGSDITLEKVQKQKLEIRKK